MGPQRAPHLGCQCWDEVAGYEEGGHVEQVNEHLVPLRQGGPEVLIA